MTAVVCVVVFVASIALSIRLGKFIKDCDRRDADRHVVAEAERIVRESAGAR